MQIQVRNPQYNAAGTIDMEIEHPVYGWVPFTASPNDVELMGRELHAQAVAGDFGPIAAHVAPPPPPPVVPQQVTRAQGKAVLIQMGLWQSVVDYVAAVPDPTQKALAEVALYDTQYWQRSSPFLNQASVALGLTSEQMDALFVQASQIEL